MKANKNKYFKASKVETNALVVYFSSKGFQANGVLDKGNTAILAETIAEELNADLFQLVSNNKHYPDDFRPLMDISKKDIDENARPGYLEDVPDFSKYKYIFVGGPAWWFYFPMIVYTFLDNHDLIDKILVPFTTHVGSGLTGIDTHLEELYPDNKILKGLAVIGAYTQDDQNRVRRFVKDWLKEILK